MADSENSVESTEPVGIYPPLIDRFGRVHTALRISVTDRCNIRCQYCMPDGPLQFLASSKLLSFDAIERFVRILTQAGVHKIRITGGEPLLRPNLHELIARLARLSGVSDLALTTNGMLLKEKVQALTDAGLRRINISLDTLTETTFEKISRRQGIDKVLEGIQAAKKIGGLQIRLNALILKHINQDDILPLAHFARSLDIPIRFIEFMPLDADRKWDGSQMLSGQQIRDLLEMSFGKLLPCKQTDPSQPARDYLFGDGIGLVGFIDSVTSPFCTTCNRLRLTAEGKVQNCLFGREDWNIAQLLQQPNSSDQEIFQLVQVAISRKHPAHGIAQPDFQPPQRAMYQIGG
ncbi:MAG: Cyclic pyranopterin monophosphate synthase [Planctomycetota bacterium]|jgi:cyclic pyranopterin phosphate synthase